MSTSVSAPAERRRVITYEDAVRAACREFLRAGTVDMDALARDLAVGRATLYRVVVGRDRLLGDVLWRLGAGLLRRAYEESSDRGAERVLAMMRRYGEDVMAAEPFRRFLQAEPATAVRVLFTSASCVHERFVALTASVLSQEAAAGALTLPFALEDVAEGLVRVFEALWHADLASGREPRWDVAECAARSLLQAG